MKRSLGIVSIAVVAALLGSAAAD
ncbi:hypothetical protein MNBD_ALPHA05-137, partial [hydrothermal vent metagenome]